MMSRSTARTAYWKMARWQQILLVKTMKSRKQKTHFTWQAGSKGLAERTQDSRGISVSVHLLTLLSVITTISVSTGTWERTISGTDLCMSPQRVKLRIDRANNFAVQNNREPLSKFILAQHTKNLLFSNSRRAEETGKRSMLKKMTNKFLAECHARHPSFHRQSDKWTPALLLWRDTWCLCPYSARNYK